VEDLKRLLNEPPELRKEIESQKRKELTTAFKTVDFDDLVTKAAAKGGNLQHKLSEIFTRVAATGSCSSEVNSTSTQCHPTMNGFIPGSACIIQFPELFPL